VLSRFGPIVPALPGDLCSVVVFASTDGAAHGAQDPQDHTKPIVSRMGMPATNPTTTSTTPRMIN
jgi:hypothetical protein